MLFKPDLNETAKTAGKTAGDRVARVASRARRRTKWSPLRGRHLRSGLGDDQQRHSQTREKATQHAHI